MDLPSEFEEENVVRGEFGGAPKLRLRDWVWRGVAVILILAFLLSLFLRGGF